jgi:hypothetical protein
MEKKEVQIQFTVIFKENENNFMEKSVSDMEIGGVIKKEVSLY